MAEPKRNTFIIKRITSSTEAMVPPKKSCNDPIAISPVSTPAKKAVPMASTAPCDFCDMVFDSREKLNAHVRWTHLNPYKCELCQVYFFDKAAINEHNEKKHRKEEAKKKEEYVIVEPPKPVISKELDVDPLDVEKPSVDQLVVIKQEEDGDSLLPCRACSQLFPDDSALLDHIKIMHLGEKPKPRPLTPADLQQLNEIQVTPGETCSCPQCDAEFRTTHSLKRHLLQVHYGMRQSHKCEECGKSFTRLDTLKEHRNAIHLKLAYKCEHCEMAFTWKTHLRRHVKSAHPERSTKLNC